MHVACCTVLVLALPTQSTVVALSLCYTFERASTQILLESKQFVHTTHDTQPNANKCAGAHTRGRSVSTPASTALPRRGLCARVPRPEFDPCEATPSAARPARRARPERALAAHPRPRTALPPPARRCGAPLGTQARRRRSRARIGARDEAAAAAAAALRDRLLVDASPAARAAHAVALPHAGGKGGRRKQPS